MSHGPAQPPIAMLDVEPELTANQMLERMLLELRTIRVILTQGFRNELGGDPVAPEDLA